MASLVAHAHPQAVPLPAATARPGGLVKLEQLTRLLRRHAWLIGLCAVAGGAGAYGYARTLPKFYTATSALTVEGDRFAIPELQGALRADTSPDPMPFVRTEVQAITSRPLVANVAEQLHLAAIEEFNPALQPPTIVQRVKAWIAPLLPSGPEDAPQSGPDEGVIGNAGRALGVFQDNRSLVISVAFTAQDPRLAANFVNTLVHDYIDSRARRRGDATEAANRSLTGRIDTAREDLAAIEREMSALRAQSGLVDLRAGTVGQQQLEELTTAAARATLERSQLEVSYQRAAAAAKAGSSDALASVLSSPTITQVRDQENTAQRRLADLSTRFGPDYPAVRSATAELASIRRQIGAEAGRIVASLDAQLRVARAQEANVKQQLDAAQRTGVATEATRAKLVQLQQEAATRRTLYQTLLERAQQTVAQPAALATPDVRVLSPAVPPGVPSGPRMTVAGLLGGLGGGVLGMLLALTRLQRMDAIATPDDVTVATGLPVLGTLSGRLLSPGRHGLRGSRAATTDGRVNAMRALRERIRFAGRGERPRTVAVMAVRDGAPSSGVSAALAMIAAADGERVLLVEPDLGRPNIARMLDLGVTARSAFIRAISGDTWQDAIVHDRTPGLQLLLAGSGPAEDGHALLRRPQFQNLLLDAREQFDLVLVDAPAADTSAAVALAQRVDLILLVVVAGTARSVLQQAERLSEVTHAPLAVLLVTGQ